MQRSYRSVNDRIVGYDIQPLNLDKWFTNAIFMAEDIKGEFENIYNALQGPIPISLSHQTQDEFLADSPVVPNEGIYPIPVTHFEEHQQIRWVLRMMGHGTTDYWCQIPQAAVIYKTIDFLCDDATSWVAQQPALRYKISWTGETKPEVILQMNIYQALFDTPAFIFIENCNGESLDIKIRVGTGVGVEKTREFDVTIGALNSQVWGVGGPFTEDPELLQQHSPGSAGIARFTCNTVETYAAQVSALEYIFDFVEDPTPTITLQTAGLLPLFTAPAFVVLTNNLTVPATVNVMLPDETTPSIVLPAGSSQLYEFGIDAAPTLPALDVSYAEEASHAVSADIATQAVNAEWAIQSRVGGTYLIDTVGKLTSQVAAEIYIVTQVGDIDLQAGTNPLFGGNNLYASKITIINLLDTPIGVIRWRNANGLQVIASDFPKHRIGIFYWDGQLIGIPDQAVYGSTSAGDYMEIREKTKGVTTLTVSDMTYTVPTGTLAQCYYLNTSLDNPGVDFGAAGWVYPAVFHVKNISTHLMSIALTGAAGSPLGLGGGLSAVIYYGGLADYGGGSSEIVLL